MDTTEPQELNTEAEEQKEFLTVAEAAAALEISEREILRRIKRGSFPGKKVDGDYAIPSATVNSPQIKDTTLMEVLELLWDAYRPQKTYSFTSSVFGMGFEDRDYHIMMVVPESALPDRLDTSTVYTRVLRQHPAAADVRIMRRKDFDTQVQEYPDSLPAKIASEGVLMFGA